MTPTEKAAELIIKFSDCIPLDTSFYDSVAEVNRKLVNDRKGSIQCAIVCVEEILIAEHYLSENTEFWNKVLTILNSQL